MDFQAQYNRMVQLKELPAGILPKAQRTSTGFKCVVGKHIFSAETAYAARELAAKFIVNNAAKEEQVDYTLFFLNLGCIIYTVHLKKGEEFMALYRIKYCSKEFALDPVEMTKTFNQVILSHPELVTHIRTHLSI